MLNAFPFLSFQKIIKEKKNKRGGKLKRNRVRVFEENRLGLGQKGDRRKGKGKNNGVYYEIGLFCQNCDWTDCL
jgi:hypothetical protein